MTAVKKDLYIEQGATFTFSFQWVRGETAETATPVDLTGFTGRMQIRQAQKKPVLAEVASGDGVTLIESAQGRVEISFSDLKTDGLTFPKAVYDLEMEAPDGTVYRLLEGNVTVSPNITQTGSEPGGV